MVCTVPAAKQTKHQDWLKTLCLHSRPALHHTNKVSEKKTVTVEFGSSVWTGTHVLKLFYRVTSTLKSPSHTIVTLVLLFGSDEKLRRPIFQFHRGFEAAQRWDSLWLEFFCAWEKRSISFSLKTTFGKRKWDVGCPIRERRLLGARARMLRLTQGVRGFAQASR